jgi:phosphate uptake regulator
MAVSKQFKSVLCGTKFIDTTAESIEEYHNYRMAASPIERIADHSHRIAHNVILFHPELDEKRIAEIKKMADFAVNSFKKAVESLITLNPKLANQVIENQEDMNLLITHFNRDYFDKSTDLSFSTMIGVRTVIDSIGRIADYAANIGEIAIDASIDSPDTKW